MKTLGRALGTGLVTLALLAPAACTNDEPPEPPGGSADVVKVLTYNTRGLLRDADGASHIDGDRWRFIDVLAERIAAERPHIVLLQEICGTQVDELAHLLGERHPMTVATVVDDGAQRNCPAPRTTAADQGHRGYGKAILTVGPAVPMVPPDTGARFGTGCVRWSGRPGLKACVVHTSAEEAPGVGKAFAAWHAALPGPLILGGDLNAVPTDRALDLLYSDRVPSGLEPDSGSGFLYEADMCTDDRCGTLVRGGEGTLARSGKPDAKFDYLFADHDHFAPWASANAEDTEGDCAGKACSDHRMLWGEFHLERTGPEGDLPIVADGRISGYVRRIDPQAGTLTLDPAQVFMGAEAIARACKEDGITPVTEWCNDYYVRNRARDELTLPLAPDATAKLYFTPGVSCAQEPCAVPLTRAAAVAAERSAGDLPGLLSHLVIKDGQVATIEHIYTP